MNESLPHSSKPGKRLLLTEIAHQWLRQTIVAHKDNATTAGQPLLALDATAGNGHDTLFLASELGSTGEVIAFDLQQTALLSTAKRLEAATGDLAKVSLICASHAQIATAVPAQWHGKVCAITFNLGYLPGGDKGIVTLRESTLEALHGCLPLLSPQGLLSVLCYRGHEEGARETEAIADWCGRHLPPARFAWRWVDAGAQAPAQAPLLLHIFHEPAAKGPAGLCANSQ